MLNYILLLIRMIQFTVLVCYLKVTNRYTRFLVMRNLVKEIKTEQTKRAISSLISEAIASDSVEFVNVGLYD